MRTDGRPDGRGDVQKTESHDHSNCRFSQFSEPPWKGISKVLLTYPQLIKRITLRPLGLLITHISPVTKFNCFKLLEEMTY
jgi:hypothetical protein